jgi:hypothetical protein
VDNSCVVSCITSNCKRLYADDLVNSVLGNSKFRGTLVLAVCAALLVSAASASAFSATPVREFPVPGGTNTSRYAPTFDGEHWTFWKGEGSGSISHFDDAGNDLGGAFSSGVATNSLGYWGGRVWLSTSSASKLVGVDVNGVQPNVSPDTSTLDRIGGNQRAIRVSSNGVISLALGQDNKVSFIDLATPSTGGLWYPQTHYGLGIATNPGVTTGINWDTCQFGNGPPGGVGGDPEPSMCGIYSGRAGAPTYPTGLNRPEDIAFGFGGSFFVTEGSAGRIAHVTNPGEGGYLAPTHFGSGPGTGAGQMNTPQSIAIQPVTNYIYVSEEANRRISVFTYGGAFIGAFGYGVLDGTDVMQTCGVGIGPCRAGTAWQSNPNSYFNRLDFVGGQLYVYKAVAHKIQVFDVGGPVFDATPPPTSNPIVNPPKEKVRLGASSTKIKKGKKATLTGTVTPATSCAGRTVLFQVKDGRSWDNIGRGTKTKLTKKGACTAVIKRKIKAKSVFRAVLINNLNTATLATSPKVTISIKKK